MVMVVTEIRREEEKLVMVMLASSVIRGRDRD